MSEVPLCRFGASSPVLRVTGTVRSQGAGDRTLVAQGEHRPGVCFVALRVIAEAWGGRAGVSRSGMALERLVKCCLDVVRRGGHLVAALVVVVGLPLIAPGSPPIGGRSSGAPPYFCPPPRSVLGPVAVLGSMAAERPPLLL